MKKIALLVLFAIGVSLFAGCTRVKTGNPVSDDALAAMNAIVEQNKDRKGYHDELKHWGLSLTDGDKFEWTKDTSANEIDYAMVLSADPFIAAGLDVEKLENSGYVFEMSTMNKDMPPANLLIHPFNVSDKRETAQGSEDALRRVLKQNPDLVSYDPQTQYYTLALGDGFAVEWTAQVGQSEDQIVFHIAAAPLVDAGLDLAELENSQWKVSQSGSAGVLSRSYTLSDTK